MARRKNKKRIDPRYFLDETTYRDLDEASDLKMVPSDSNKPTGAVATGDAYAPPSMHQKLLDAGIDPGHLNACKDSPDLVKCLYFKNVGSVRAMRDAGLIPQQPGS